MAAGPIEIARVAKRLFQQAHPERYWSSATQSVQQPGAPIFATDAERQHFLKLAKIRVAQEEMDGPAEAETDGAPDTPAAKKRSR